MHPTIRRFILATLLGSPCFCTGAEAVKPRTQAEVEPATRLQVFLDRAEFAPGKIDGRYGEFTLKSLALYRKAHGAAVPAEKKPKGKAKEKSKDKPKEPTAPDVSGLDLDSVNPVFITYTVAEADLQALGEVPESVAAQAKLKSLGYKDAAEAIAEKFHCDAKFLAEMNPGKVEKIKAGDQLLVPNVGPFELAAVKDLKPGDEVAANDRDEADKDTKGKPADATPIKTTVKVDIKANMVSVFEDDKLTAAYPVTVGSQHTESPVGDWKVRGFEKMPKFRYDKSMLNKGERSSNFHMLPPGPNNPVGVMWIALNKKGIGLHGTSDPDSIGRSASHGCIRLANWDVVRLSRKVKAGVPVMIH